MKIPGNYCFRGFSFFISVGEGPVRKKQRLMVNKKGNFILNEAPFFISNLRVNLSY